MSMHEGGEALDLVAAVERIAANRRLGLPTPRTTAPLAAHYRADPEDARAVEPDPFLELGDAVEHFNAAWTDLQAKIRRAIAGRQGR